MMEFLEKMDLKIEEYKQEIYGLKSKVFSILLLLNGISYY